VPDDIRVELKIDTGMSRLGVPWQESRGWIEKFSGRLAGVFSHFGSADCDPELTRLQTRRFLEATAGLECRRHLCNSAGLAYPEAWLDAVRVGLALYGVCPCPRLSGLDLQPALSWKARILAVNRVAAGSSSGYGATWTANRPSRLGILPVGYADSYSRLHSNQGQVEVCGRLAPVVGAVSMDLTTIDLTDIPQARPGDEAVLLSNESASPLCAASLARQRDTIPYEVLTAIPEHLKRVFVED
jgi:alanine racemase